jgi:uncharacterized protein
MNIRSLLFALSLALTALSASPSMADLVGVTGPQKGLRVETLSIATLRGPRILRVEIADTDKSREIGMMWRTSVPRNTGMLFDFKTSQPVTFWMENTLSSLDIIFIRSDGTIANIAANAAPLSRELIPSEGPIVGVLEIGAGQARQLGLAAGQKVSHPMFKRPSGRR